MAQATHAMQMAMLLQAHRSDADYQHPYSVGQEYVYRWRSVLKRAPQAFWQFVQCFRSPDPNQEYSFEDFVAACQSEKLCSQNDQNFDHYGKYRISVFLEKMAPEAIEVLRVCLQGDGAYCTIMDFPITKP